jgi:quercetin dioxygenase-like cupin family protein
VLLTGPAFAAKLLLKVNHVIRNQVRKMVITAMSDKIMCETRSGNRIYWLVTSEMGAPNFEVRYIEIPPGGKSSYGSHSHEHGVFIVRGRGKIRGKEEEHPLYPGLGVFVPGNEEHQWVNESTVEPFGFICVVPKGAEKEAKPPCFQ